MTYRDITYARADMLRRWVLKQRALGIEPAMEDKVHRLSQSTGAPLTAEEHQWALDHSDPSQVQRRKKKAKVVASPSPSPATALANLQRHVKSVALESPPPGFRPAIPLREAIDTVNAYAAEEGDALELTISKRGRLKVRYEYGG